MGAGFGVVVGIVDVEALALGGGDELLELEVGALGVEDGLRDIGENAGSAFGNVAASTPEEDGIEDVCDAFGGVEVFGHAIQEVDELFGAAVGEVVLAEGLLGGDREVAAGRAGASDVRATRARGGALRSGRRCGGQGWR